MEGEPIRRLSSAKPIKMEGSSAETRPFSRSATSNPNPMPATAELSVESTDVKKPRSRKGKNTTILFSGYLVTLSIAKQQRQNCQLWRDEIGLFTYTT